MLCCLCLCWCFNQKLFHLQQAHDKTLVSINNHLVNGKGNELGGGVSGGSLSEGRLNSMKEEILSELERRVSLSCSSCQVSDNFNKPIFQNLSSRCFSVRLNLLLDVFRPVWRICANSSSRTVRGFELWRSR